MKKIIDLSGPEGNVFKVIHFAVTDLKGVEPNTSKHAKEVQRYVDLGSYDAILTDIESEYGDQVEFINKP